MKAVKIFGFVFVLLVVMVAGIIAYVYGNINQIVKETIESVGSELTQTRVVVRDVDIKLLKGKGELNRFEIGNPLGYKSDHLLNVQSFVLEIDPKTVGDKVVVIKNILVKGMHINVEQIGYSTNIQALLDNMDSDEPSAPNKNSPARSTEGASSNDSGAELRLALEYMQFSDTSIELISEWGSYTMTLSNFDIANIGDKQTGLTPEELGDAILEPVLKQAKKQAEARLKSLAQESLKDEAEKLKQKAKQKKKELTQSLENGKSKLENKLEKEKQRLKQKYDESDLKDKLKNLF